MHGFIPAGFFVLSLALVHYCGSFAPPGPPTVPTTFWQHLRVNRTPAAARGRRKGSDDGEASRTPPSVSPDLRGLHFLNWTHPLLPRANVTAERRDRILRDLGKPFLDLVEDGRLPEDTTKEQITEALVYSLIRLPPHTPEKPVVVRQRLRKFHEHEEIERVSRKFNLSALQAQHNVTKIPPINPDLLPHARWAMSELGRMDRRRKARAPGKFDPEASREVHDGDGNGGGTASATIVDEQTFNHFKNLWHPKHLQNFKKNFWWLYVPESEKDSPNWLPLNDSSSSFILPVAEDRPQYEYYYTFYDPKRNFTWSYKKFAPNKGLTIGDRNISWLQPWDLRDNQTKRWLGDFTPIPERLLDNGTFRQPPLEDQFSHGMDRQAPVKGFDDFGLPAENTSRSAPTLWTLHHPGLKEGLSFRKLGKSDVVVPEICLGGMTFGYPTTEHDAHDLLDNSLQEFGLNFFDTAELYPLPALPSHFGLSESIIGSWLRTRLGPHRRNEVVIATKVAGLSPNLFWIPDQRGFGGSVGEEIIAAAEGSISRMGCGYIDLLQLHWPIRYVPSHRSGDYHDVLYDYRLSNPNAAADLEQMKSQVRAVGSLLKQGKIRAWGLSNETPWGVLKFTALAEDMGVDPPASVQLEYSLLCRNDLEKGFVELARPQNCGIALLAYSPLAGGVLTGKYLETFEYTTSGRLLRFPSYMKRYRGSLASRAVKEYHELALKMGKYNLCQMALGWVYTRPFLCSTIVGATDRYQLRENVLCLSHPVTDKMERCIKEIHWRWRDPIRIIQ